MSKLYEDNIKELILDKKHIFIKDTDNTTVVFEKGIVVSNTIADCLIFSQEQGIIGIEIKTEYDTIKRLKSQLKDYSTVCDLVYVLCHDKHVERTEELLEELKQTHVGILAYTSFRGEAILGVYRKALSSPKKSVHMALQMLWKDEIISILETLYKEEEYNYKRIRKSNLIGMIVKKLGQDRANRLLAEIFISQKMHPDKLIKFNDFR